MTLLNLPAATVLVDIPETINATTHAVVPVPLGQLVFTQGTLVVDVLVVLGTERDPAAGQQQAEGGQHAVVAADLGGELSGLVLPLGLDILQTVGTFQLEFLVVSRPGAVGTFVVVLTAAVTCW